MRRMRIRRNAAFRAEVGVMPRWSQPRSEAVSTGYVTSAGNGAYRQARERGTARGGVYSGDGPRDWKDAALSVSEAFSVRTIRTVARRLGGATCRRRRRSPRDQSAGAVDPGAASHFITILAV